MDQFCGGVLILNRASLVQNYCLEPSRYAEDWKYDEREKNVLGRSMNIRRHLLGVVRQTDVDAILGPPRHPVFPDGYFGWPDRKLKWFWKEERRLAQEIVGEDGPRYGRLFFNSGARRALLIACHFEVVKD